MNLEDLGKSKALEGVYGPGITKETKSEKTVAFTTSLIYYTCESVATSHKESEGVKIVQ